MSLFDRVRAALGFRAGAPRPKPSTRVVPSLSLWQQFHRIGGGLTPVQVSAILREADAGYTSRLIDLANESRQKDCHLQGCLEQVEESLTGLPWELALPANPKAKEKRAAEWVEAELRENPSFYTLIGHLAGSIYYGFAVAEISWARKNGRLVPAAFDVIDARRFGFRHEDGRLVWRDQGMGDGVDLREAFPAKFVISQPRVNGDVPCREGLARLLVWAALFRNWTMTDWLRLGEIAWKPWRIGKYDKNAAKEDIDGLLDVLEGMSTNGIAKLPETIDVDVKWAPGATTKPLHEVLYETVAREMSKATIGQTETIQSSTSSGYAQAKVHNEVRKDLREARARQIASDITRDVVQVMTLLNFGPSVRPSSLEFITQDPVDLAAFSIGVKTLKDAGTRIPQSWVREQAGIPEPKEGEELLGDVDIPIDPTTGLPEEPEEAPEPTPFPPVDAYSAESEALAASVAAVEDRLAALEKPPPPVAERPFAERHAAFQADLRDYRANHLKLDQARVTELAVLHDVPIPEMEDGEPRL